MEDPNLIATLIPLNDLTKHVFSYEHNGERSLPPTGGFNDGPVISSREATPQYELPQKDDRGGNFENTYRLLLNFDNPPMDPSKVYAFGTDRQKCDVLLAARGVHGISRVHFHISFDVIDGVSHLVLRDSSTNGTAVSYDGHGSEDVRHHYTWVLDLWEHEEGGEGCKIKVRVQGLSFEVKLASHRTCEAEYDLNVRMFLNRSRSQNADPPEGASTCKHNPPPAGDTDVDRRARNTSF